MSKLTDIIEEIAQPVCQANGVELWELEYVNEGGRRVLRIYIDKPDGAGVNDCEAVSRALDPLLDDRNPIAEAYTLEVSTPGMERALTRPWHFERYLGQQVEARLFSPIDGSKVFCGTLVSRGGDGLILEIDGRLRTLPDSALSRVKLSPDYSRYFQ